MKKQKSNAPSYFNMQFITSTISTMLVLLLLGFVVFFVMAANNLSIYVRENLTFTILVEDGMSEAEVLSMQTKLEKEAFVKEAAFISKEQALQEQTDYMGTDPQEFLGYNPLKASIEVKLKSEYANSDSIAKIESTIMQYSNVQDIMYQKDLIDEVNNNIRTISFILLTLALVLTLISFALINNTIRLAIYAKRFLIHTMKLVGASWNFIRRPFLVQNIWGGLLAAIFANVILVAIAYWLIGIEPELIRVITPQITLVVMVSVLVLGVMITFVCSYISINKYLRMKANTLYHV